jgi:hypothetical protein
VTGFGSVGSVDSRENAKQKFLSRELTESTEVTVASGLLAGNVGPAFIHGFVSFRRKAGMHWSNG